MDQKGVGECTGVVLLLQFSQCEAKVTFIINPNTP
jgi:hypothetical protein